MGARRRARVSLYDIRLLSMLVIHSMSQNLHLAEHLSIPPIWSFCCYF